MTGPLQANAISRRQVLGQGGTALAALALLDAAFSRALAATDAQVIPWLDQPPPIPPAAASVIRNLQPWEALTTWITPNDRFFGIAHYELPTIDVQNWSLEIGGLVEHPRRLALADLEARPRQDVTFTIECSGDRGLPFFMSGIGNAKWAGTPLAAVLAEAKPTKNAIEVAFIGSDAGEETVRDLKFNANFARSMSLTDAMGPDNLLCYEMNGEALPPLHGAPLRLIAPGWYGIANVKWLRRIELRDTRLENRFMGRDYVTIHEESHNGRSTWTETSVGRARLSSAPGRVVRQDGVYRILGAAWGAPIANVEVQIDGGPWLPAAIERLAGNDFAWRFWSLAWTDATPGEHRITSRAIDAAGNLQPAMDDPSIAGKHTYWESNGQMTRRITL